MKNRIATGTVCISLLALLFQCSKETSGPVPAYRTQVETGNLDSARTVLEQLVTANPQDADALLYLGKLYCAGNDWMKAVSTLQKAAALDTTGWQAGYFLALSYDKLGNYDASLDAFRKYVAGRYAGIGTIDTSYAAVAAAKVRMLFSRKAKDLDRIAAMSLKKYAEAAPDSPELLPLMAEAAYKTAGETVAGDKMQRRAYELIRKKVKRKGSEKDLLLLDARFRDTRKDRMEAWEEGQRKFPDEPRFHTLDGYDELKYTDNTGALEAFGKALQLNPLDLDAMIGAGIAHLRQGDGKEALALIEKAVAQDPASAIAHYNLGVVYGKLRQGKKAIAEYRKALILDPHYVDAMYNLGRMYYLFNQFTISQATLERVLILDPGYADAAVIIANIMIKNQKLEEAWTILKGVLKHDPDNEVIKQNLMRIPHHVRSK